jgi:hypothetical protein
VRRVRALRTRKEGKHVQRRSTEHSPRVDDELKRETSSLERGAPVEARVEEERLQAGPGDDERLVAARTAPAEALDPDGAEPGLDRHEWESEMALIQDDLRTSPVDALPELVDLVHRMLVERGYIPDEQWTPDDQEIVGEFRQARAVAESAAAWDDQALGDVADAIQRLQRLYDVVLAERRAP